MLAACMRQSSLLTIVWCMMEPCCEASGAFLCISADKPCAEHAIAHSILQISKAGLHTLSMSIGVLHPGLKWFCGSPMTARLSAIGHPPKPGGQLLAGSR